MHCTSAIHLIATIMVQL